MTRVTLTGDQFIFFLLLFRMGIMASIASALITSSFFKRLIFLDTRNTKENFQFAFVFGALLLAGTAGRVLVGYEGVDLSLSGTFLLGLMGGMVPGSSVGFFVSLPALLGGEWVTLPFAVICGLIGGFIRRRTENRDEFWDFSPILPNNILESAKLLMRGKRLDSRALIFIAVLSLDVIRTIISGLAPTPVLFAFRPDHFWVTPLVWLSTLACVGIPIKIWNNTRVEMMLEEQRSAAVQARFDALRSQINPHFLFNTLNTATSCIWTDQEKARWILVKLSAILRRLLHGTKGFVPLSREVEFIEDYLSLERARFGEENIRFEIDMDPRSLDVQVPSMILQPLVENAVRHGISPRVGGGLIEIRTEIHDGFMRITVRDDGLGFAGEIGRGIGLTNVSERLKMAYGGQSSFSIDSTPGGGTTVKIGLPAERGKTLAR